MAEFPELGRGRGQTRDMWTSVRQRGCHRRAEFLPVMLVHEENDFMLI